MMNNKKPNLYIIAGPNGAGKTTFAKTYLPSYAKCNEFVNADMIAKGLAPFRAEQAALQAGRLMLDRISDLSEKKADFAIESTLSGKTYLTLITRLKSQGYRIHIIFLWLSSASLACRRVSDRVGLGGHNIPVPVIRRRFKAGLLNFIKYYGPLCDFWTLFDNSNKQPVLIAQRKNEKLEIIQQIKYAKIIKGSGSNEKK